jgi:PadR family transcriptional regulator, regulatory protein PadR
MSEALKTTEFYILLALADAPMHGYGIMKHVQRESGGDVRLEIGSLYRLLARLADQELIEEAEADDRRKYYRLTRLGRRALRAEAARMAGLMGIFRERNLLPEGDA